MPFSSRRWERWVARAGGGLLLAAVAMFLAASFSAAERGGPAVGGDGEWHAARDWTIEGGDDLSYDGVTVHAPGSLTLDEGARLRLSNVTLLFDGQASGGGMSVGAGATIRVENTSVRADAPNFTVTVVQGTFDCTDSRVSVDQPPADEHAFHVDVSTMFANHCTISSGAGPGFLATGSTVHAVNSAFERLPPLGPWGSVEFQGQGDYVLDGTLFGQIATDKSALVTLYSSVTFRLLNGTGADVPGRVNGTTAEPRFFQTASDENGTFPPVSLFWTRLGPDPVSLPADAVYGPPGAVTGVAPGIGGNSTVLDLHSGAMVVPLSVVSPYDVGLQPISVQGGSLSNSGPRTFYVDLGTNHTVTVGSRNSDGLASPPLVVQVRQYEADPGTLAVYGTWRDIGPLEAPSLQPSESTTLSFELEFGEWGRRTESSGSCWHTTRYTSVIEVKLLVAPGDDYGPWNDTVRVGVVAFRVEGDPSGSCTAGSDTGQLVVGGAVAAGIGGALLLGYYSSGQRVARRAARREGPPPSPSRRR